MRISDWSSDVCSSDLELAAVPEAHIEHRRLDDDPRVHPVLLDDARMADAPDAIPVLRQPLEQVIGLDRLAAVADEAENARDGVGGERRIGQRAAYAFAHFRLL